MILVNLRFKHVLEHLVQCKHVKLREVDALLLQFDMFIETMKETFFVAWLSVHDQGTKLGLLVARVYKKSRWTTDTHGMVVRLST